MILKLVRLLKNILPDTINFRDKIIFKWIKYLLHPFYMWYYHIKLKKIQQSHSVALKEVLGKQKIKVVFFLINDSVWKYDRIYKLMDADGHFDPLVVVCPYVVYGESTMFEDMKKAHSFCQKKGYNVISSYNSATNQWIDVKKDIKPDLVFFTNPHELTKDEYYIRNYLDTLTCYVQYSFHITHLHHLQYNQKFHNYIWKNFCETKIHQDFAKKYAANKGINTVVSGYPAIDVYFDKNYIPEDVWKLKDRNILRIIWAPHHTIPDQGADLNYSNFLKYADKMFDLINEYNDKIQIAFKPHPILRPKLQHDSVWGKSRTDQYYSKWASLLNGQLVDSEYSDLFLTSDALVHDSASFMTEYLCTNKPSLFLVSDPGIKDRFNEFGKEVFELHYQADSIDGIRMFIDEVLISKKDDKKVGRENFISKSIVPPNGKSASENIIEELLISIFKQK